MRWRQALVAGVRRILSAVIASAAKQSSLRATARWQPCRIASAASLPRNDDVVFMAGVWVVIGWGFLAAS
jgi:hypothetical protein